MSERKKAAGISKEIFELLKEQAAPGQEQQLAQVTIDEDLPDAPFTGAGLPSSHELYPYLKSGTIQVGPDTSPDDLELFRQYQIPVESVPSGGRRTFVPVGPSGFNWMSTQGKTARELSEPKPTDPTPGFTEKAAELMGIAPAGSAAYESPGLKHSEMINQGWKQFFTVLAGQKNLGAEMDKLHSQGLATFWGNAVDMLDPDSSMKKPLGKMNDLEYRKEVLGVGNTPPVWFIKAYRDGKLPLEPYEIEGKTYRPLAKLTTRDPRSGAVSLQVQPDQPATQVSDPGRAPFSQIKQEWLKQSSNPWKYRKDEQGNFTSELERNPAWVAQHELLKPPEGWQQSQQEWLFSPDRARALEDLVKKTAAESPGKLDAVKAWENKEMMIPMVASLTMMYVAPMVGQKFIQRISQRAGAGSAASAEAMRLRMAPRGAAPSRAPTALETAPPTQQIPLRDMPTRATSPGTSYVDPGSAQAFAAQRWVPPNLFRQGRYVQGGPRGESSPLPLGPPAREIGSLQAPVRASDPNVLRAWSEQSLRGESNTRMLQTLRNWAKGVVPKGPRGISGDPISQAYNMGLVTKEAASQMARRTLSTLKKLDPRQYSGYAARRRWASNTLEVLSDGMVLYTLFKLNEFDDPALRRRLTSGSPIFQERQYSSRDEAGIVTYKILADDIQQRLGINVEIPVVDKDVEHDERDVIEMLKRQEKLLELLEKYPDYPDTNTE